MVGILIRDAKGAVLAQKGDAPRELPTSPAAVVEQRESVSEKGEPGDPVPGAGHEPRRAAKRR